MCRETRGHQGAPVAAAFELSRRLPGSAVCDPSHVGSAMKRMLPASLWPGSWPDIPAWRHSVLELLRLTLTEHDGPVIAPAMLLNLGHYQEIIGGLRDGGFEVHHFALLAEPATVIRRLHARSLGLGPRTRPWEAEHLDEWLERLGHREGTVGRLERSRGELALRRRGPAGDD
jgi:hypothetical protein